MPVQPKKPIVRRFGKLIVRLDRDGLSVRGHLEPSLAGSGASWEEIGWLCMTSGKDSMFSEIEGRAFLERIGAA